MKRSLAWIDTHSAGEMVDALGVTDVGEREALLDALRMRKDIYSPDGRFSDDQIATVERFFHATEISPAAGAFAMKSIIDDRWAGRSP